MALPKQVQAQLAEVEKLEKELEAQGTKEEDPKEEDPKEEDLKEEVTETLEIVPEETEVEIPDEQPTEEPAQEEVKSTDNTEGVSDNFKQKYSTLKGKYDAEVPRLHLQVKELTEQLGDIRKDIETAKKEESEKPKEKISYVTDADREEYGDDLIDFQRRVAKEVSQENEERFKQQGKVITELREQLVNTDTQIGEMSFSQKLNDLVPGFSQLDNDERWATWLNEYDPMSRGPRRDQAQAAFNSGDADAIAHYVKLFRESIEPINSGKSSRQTELEKQVTPSRSASPNSGKGTGRSSKVYSVRESEKAWTKIRTLNTKGKTEEAAKLEAELTAAYMEGRVRQ